MAKSAIDYLKREGIENTIVFQSKDKRVWLSDLLDVYADDKVVHAFNAYRRGAEMTYEHKPLRPTDQ